MELGCHIYSDIAPVPWLDFILIYSLSLLIALSPAIEVSVRLEPSNILLIATVREEVIFRCRIKYINCESELVF